MGKDFTSGIAAVGPHAVLPKSAVAPRRRVQQHADERDDDEQRELSPPPPGMGTVVDKSA